MNDEKPNPRDDGADRATRLHPCIKKTWCTHHREHSGPCEVVNRPLPKDPK